MMATGAKLGPYEILDALGAGGMGEVYRARDTRLERTVAIKILPGQFSSDDPEEVIHRITDYRAADKHDPVCYARHTVMKAQAEIQRRSAGARDAGLHPIQELDMSNDP